MWPLPRGEAYSSSRLAAAPIVARAPAERWREGQLAELPGIGAHIASKIGELVETGACREHTRLAAQVPSAVLEVLRLEGMGPKTVEAV